MLAAGLCYTEDPGILLSSLWITIPHRRLPPHPGGWLQQLQLAVGDTCAPTWQAWASERPDSSQTALTIFLAFNASPSHSNLIETHSKLDFYSLIKSHLPEAQPESVQAKTAQMRKLRKKLSESLSVHCYREGYGRKKAPCVSKERFL